MKNLLAVSAFLLLIASPLAAQDAPVGEGKPAPAKADDTGAEKKEAPKTDPEALKALDDAAAKVHNLSTSGITRASWDVHYAGEMMGQKVESKLFAGWTNLLTDTLAQMKYQEGFKDNIMAGISIDNFVNTYILATGGEARNGPMSSSDSGIVTFGTSKVEGEKVVHIDNSAHPSGNAPNFNLTIGKDGLLKGFAATDDSFKQTLQYEVIDEKTYAKGFIATLNRQGMAMDMTFTVTQREAVAGFHFPKTITLSMNMMGMPVAYTYTSSNIKLNADATDELLKKAGIAEDMLPKAAESTPPVTGEKGEKKEDKPVEGEKKAEPAKKE